MSTVEVRWFFQEDPGLASALFSGGHEPAERTDWYAPPNDERTGTKFREGRLETKLRLRVRGEVVVGKATGVLEEWEKWGSPLEQPYGPANELLELCGWIAVEKRRRLRVYKRVDREELVETKEWRNDWPAAGVQFECTELQAHGQRAWTIGLEAFGAAEENEPNLRRVASKVLANPDHQALLTSANSFGYPKWLQELA